LVVHLLQDRGVLDINDRVTDYIPEYGRHGKGGTTIAHVLAHRAGVSSLPPKVLTWRHSTSVRRWSRRSPTPSHS
jgi:CubicO group peptidase (beta-lactamase class C family)